MNEDQAQQTQQKRHENKTGSGWVFKAGVFLVLILLLVTFWAWNEKRNSEVISVAENVSEFSDKEEEEKEAEAGCLGSGFYFEGKPEDQFNSLLDAFSQFEEPERENREPQWSNWLHNGDEIAEFVNKHPIICDINETYALVYKLSDEALAQSTSGLAKIRSAVYLKNKIKEQEVLLYEDWDVFMPGATDTYSARSGGMRGLFFEILPDNKLYVAWQGGVYFGSWQHNRVVNLNDLDLGIAYKFSREVESIEDGNYIVNPNISIENLKTGKSWDIKLDIDQVVGEVGTLGTFNINGISVNGNIVQPLSLTLNPIVKESMFGKSLAVRLDYSSEASGLVGPKASPPLKDIIEFNEDFSKTKFNLVVSYKANPDSEEFNESVDLGEFEIDLN